MTRKTNSEFMQDLMDLHSPLMQAFIIEGLRVYSEMTLAAPAWDGNPMLSQEAWNICASDYLEKHRKQYGKDT